MSFAVFTNDQHQIGQARDLLFCRSQIFGQLYRYGTCFVYLRKASRGVSVTKDQPRAGSDEGGAMPKRLLPVIALSMALISPVVVQGCSSQRETTTTTTSEQPQSAPTTTLTTTTTTSNEPDSVLGATFHAIGTIILFPFRLVGDAIGLIV